MLGKLLKYDIKANWIYFLIMYGGVIGYSVLFRLLLEMNQKDTRVQFALFSAVMGYVLVVAAFSILTLILIVVRFYKNMFGPEGYLTNTLPVSPAAHLASKMISGFLWYVLCFGVGALSVFIVTMGEFEDIKSLTWNILQITVFREGYAIFWLYVVETFVGALSGIGVMYFVLCLGQLANRHRILCSIGYYIAFVVINWMLQFILSMFLVLIFRGETGGYTYTLANQGGIIALNVVYLVISMIVGHYIIARKLNLE